jgi:hypothetical protein
MNAATSVMAERPLSETLAGIIQSKLGNPEHSPNFDLWLME